MLKACKSICIETQTIETEQSVATRYWNFPNPVGLKTLVRLTILTTLSLSGLGDTDLVDGVVHCVAFTRFQRLCSYCRRGFAKL